MRISVCVPLLRAQACAWVHVLMLDKLAPTHKDTKATSPKASFACMHTLAPALARVHHSSTARRAWQAACAIPAPCTAQHPGPCHHQRAQVRLGGPSQPRPLHTVCCVMKLTAAPSCTPYPCLHHRRGPCAAAPSLCTCTCACPTPRNGARTCSSLARVRAPGNKLLERMHTVGGKRVCLGPAAARHLENKTRSCCAPAV